MSRAVWIAVGAVGGIYAYRRGQRALDDARERGLVGNVQYAANTAASVAQGTARLVSLATAPQAETIEYIDWEDDRRVKLTPVRRTPLIRRDSRVPATAMKLEALQTEPVVDVRSVRAPRRAAVG